LKKQICLFVLVAVFVVSSFASQLSVDSFLPPAKGGPTQPETTVKETGEDGVAAENLQDGLIYANNLIWDQGGEGFKSVVFGSGIGFIAGAKVDYYLYPNINATLIGKRAAYLEAYYKAKEFMAQGLYGYETREKESMDNTLTAIDTEDQNIGSIFRTQDTTNETFTSGILRGIVTYEVRDEAEAGKGTVYVSIAISPSTLRAVNQVTDGILLARTKEDGLGAILYEIQTGIVPPIGGKIVIFPDTGETIVVAFGSAIVRHSENTKLASEYEKVAKEASRMRAGQALVDFLKGREHTWNTSIIEDATSASGSGDLSFSSINEEVTVVSYEDEKWKSTFVTALAKEFLSVMIRTSDYSSIGEGRVPPGVIFQTAVDESVETLGYGWAYTVAVYYPPLALNINNLVNPQSIPEPVESLDKPTQATETTQEPFVNPQGPTGQVSDNSGL